MPGISLDANLHTMQMSTEKETFTVVPTGAWMVEQQLTDGKGC